MIILNPQLGVSPKATTGGETYDRELLKQFIKLDVNTKILLPRQALAPEELQRSIDRTLLSHFVPPYAFNLFAFPWVLKKIEGSDLSARSDPSEMALRIHSPEYLFPTAYLIKKLFPKLPIVAHYHLDQTGKLWTKMNNTLLNVVEAVIADSEFLKKQLVDRVGVSEKKISVIHCGVDVDSIKPKAYKGPTLNTQGRSLSHAKTILFLGRFIRRKRPDFVLEVFASLHKKHPDTKLVMVGEGPMEEKLRDQSIKLKIQSAVEFPGPLFEEDKLKRYHESDLFLFPSEKEGFVLVILEAMAAGLPLLVPNALGFPEAVQHGKNGFLVGGNVAEWVKSAEAILYNSSINKEMRRQSRKISIEKFSWKLCAQRNIDVYRQILRR